MTARIHAPEARIHAPGASRPYEYGMSLWATNTDHDIDADKLTVVARHACYAR
jgi:hypothetical protein